MESTDSQIFKVIVGDLREKRRRRKRRRESSWRKLAPAGSGAKFVDPRLPYAARVHATACARVCSYAAHRTSIANRVGEWGGEETRAIRAREESYGKFRSCLPFFVAASIASVAECTPST